MRIIAIRAAIVLAGVGTQRKAIEAIRARMAAAAQAPGREIVAAERSLEAVFAEKRIDAAALETRAGATAALMGRLRAVHLAAHIGTEAQLTEAQAAHYAQLRGHGGDAKPHEHHRRKH